MALYAYRKARQKNKRLLWRRFLAGGFLGLGLLLLAWLLAPLLHYQFFYGAALQPIVDPLPEETSVSSSQSGDKLLKIENWFITKPSPAGKIPYQGISYFLTIPKLKIYQANVIVAARNLAKSLGQYPKTALPGQPGNTVILGHSVLPQFFNPHNYLTIFSPLYRLREGDQIIVDYGQRRYFYRVRNIYEVSPHNLKPLRQDFRRYRLTLITCSPPGTSLRRLIVEADLVSSR